MTGRVCLTCTRPGDVASSTAKSKERKGKENPEKHLRDPGGEKNMIKTYLVRSVTPAPWYPYTERVWNVWVKASPQP